MGHTGWLFAFNVGFHGVGLSAVLTLDWCRTGEQGHDAAVASIGITLANHAHHVSRHHKAALFHTALGEAQQAPFGHAINTGT